MQLSAVVRLDVTDSSSATSSTYGLVAGEFYWCTGRDATASGELAGKTLKTGIITDDINDTDRMVDLIDGGDYSTLSSFAFDIHRASDVIAYCKTNNIYLINRTISVYIGIDDVYSQIWSGLLSDIEIKETSFRIKCVSDVLSAHKIIPPRSIDKYSYPDATDDAIGKPIPVILGKVSNSPLLKVDSNEKILNLSRVGGNNYTFATANRINGSTLYINTIDLEFISDDFFRTIKYYLRVLNGEFAGTMYPIIKINGTDKTLEHSSSWVTSFTLGLRPQYEGITFNNDHATDEYTSGTDYNFGHSYYENGILFFELVEAETRFIISNAYVHNLLDNKSIYNYYNKDNKKFYSAYQYVFNSYAAPDSGESYASFILPNKNKEEDEFIWQYITPKKVEGWCIVPFDEITNDFENDENSEPTDCPLLIDTYRATKMNVTTESVGDSRIKLVLNYYLPDNIDRESIEELYLLIDYNCYDNFESVPSCDRLQAQVMIRLHNGYLSDAIHSNVFTSVGNHLNYPNSTIDSTYFSGAGALPIYERYFDSPIDESSDNVSEKFKVSDSRLIPKAKYFILELVFDVLDEAIEANLEVTECVFYAKIKMKKNAIADDFYINTDGETNNANYTNLLNTVHEVLLRIRETYDGADSLTFTDTSTNRYLGWECGQTLLTKKRSSEYIKELCSQFFFSFITTRDGQKLPKCFFENEELIATHTDLNGAIIKDSIRVDYSPINNIYNDIELNYKYNYASKSYDEKIFIKNATPFAVFPEELDAIGQTIDITDDYNVYGRIDLSLDTMLYTINTTTYINCVVRIDNSDIQWELGDYISYISDIGNFYFAEIFSISPIADESVFTIRIPILDNTIAYGTARNNTHGDLIYVHKGKQRWKSYAGGIGSYEESKRLWEICRDSANEFKTNNELPSNLKNLSWVVTESVANKVLGFVLGWCTRQKLIVSYTIPITATNLGLELCDRIHFADSIYTDSEEKEGFISKIRVSYKEKKIFLEVVLLPDNLNLDLDGLIIESGDAPDTITESGSQTDTITETGI
jgi:hypothetical protein